jgi:uncharacterized protein (DUF1499 family)
MSLQSVHIAGLLPGSHPLPTWTRRKNHMSRSYQHERTVRSNLSLWFGAASLILLPLGALGTRYGFWSYSIGIVMVMLAFLSALVPVALFIGFAWHPRHRTERRGLSTGMLMAAIPLAIAAYLYSIGGSAPIIHDISTDTVRPPEYLAAAKQREPDDNPLVWSESVGQAQRESYHDLHSIESALTVEQALERAGQVAQELGWEIIDRESRAGYLEAVDTSFWFGFKDDIVIRVEPGTSGSVIDLRSTSRVGRGDLGANARRIKQFIEKFNGG